MSVIYHNVLAPNLRKMGLRSWSYCISWVKLQALLQLSGKLDYGLIGKCYLKCRLAGTQVIVQLLLTI